MSSEWPAPFQPVGPPPPPPPPPSPVRAGRSPLEYFLAGGIVVGVIVAVVLIALTASAIATTPASTTPLTTATGGPSGSLAPAGSVPVDIAAQIDAVIAQMPAIRELDKLRDVPYSMITRDQFKADLDVLVDEEIDPDLLAAQGRLLERLSLLPPGTDLRQLLLDLNGGAVAAFYRPDTGAFYVIERSEPFGALDRVYVAHEYTHALQDQHFDLEGTRITDPAEGDAALAQLAVVEGDATAAMVDWATQYLALDELIEILRSALSGTDQQILDRMPPILNRQLTFPYSEGMTFVTQIRDQGGWEAVNQAVQHPPASTEQILHPQKYAAHEAPVSVALPDPTEQLGAGWKQVYVDTFGELNIQIFAAGDERPAAVIPGMPGGEWPHADAAAGWGGDRIYMWEGANDAWAIGWTTAWDTPADADEFVARATELQSRFAGPAAVSLIKPDIAQVLIASDVAALTQLAAAAGN